MSSCLKYRRSTSSSSADCGFGFTPSARILDARTNTQFVATSYGPTYVSGLLNAVGKYSNASNVAVTHLDREVEHFRGPIYAYSRPGKPKDNR